MEFTKKNQRFKGKVSTLDIKLIQQTRGIEPMLFQCWSTVYDGGPTLKQHWLNVCW